MYIYIYILGLKFGVRSQLKDKFSQRRSAVAFFKIIFQVVNSKDLRDAKYFFLNLMMSFSIFPRLDCFRQVVFKEKAQRVRGLHLHVKLLIQSFRINSFEFLNPKVFSLNMTFPQDFFVKFVFINLSIIVNMQDSCKFVKYASSLNL